MSVRLAKGRKSGKSFVMLLCPADGRHFRGFITDKAYVASVLGKLEAQASKSPFTPGLARPTRNRTLTPSSSS